MEAEADHPVTMPQLWDQRPVNTPVIIPQPDRLVITVILPKYDVTATIHSQQPNDPAYDHVQSQQPNDPAYDHIQSQQPNDPAYDHIQSQQPNDPAYDCIQSQQPNDPA